MRFGIISVCDFENDRPGFPVKSYLLVYVVRLYVGIKYGDVLSDMLSKVVGVIQNTHQKMACLSLLQWIESC